MAQRSFNPEHSEEVRAAIDAVLDAMAKCHSEVAAFNTEVVRKIAQVARVLGWPDHVVAGVIDQMQNIAEMQIKVIDHTMEVWREQIKSWPRLTAAGHWPDAEALKAMSSDPVQFWTRLGEQWQKNWAQKVMSDWAKSSKRNAPPKSDDRE
jgi:hypothetical protein